MRDRLPMIFSITALLVALFGTTPLGEAAYNAVLPRGSVDTPQLQRNAVTAAKIAPNAIRGSHVLDGTLLTADFKAGQIPQGAKGDKGDTGAQGTAGKNGATSVVIRGTYFVSSAGATASCNSGERATGGGVTGDKTIYVATKSEPVPNSGTPTGWSGRLYSLESGVVPTGTVYVICASP
jgi:hypothetical protein